ncbi:MAG: hypothetical protein KJ737_25960 [Proteobacteria bacterium]|nr:hypothetical protein [Pseudomonadota bacterium]
MGSEVVIESRDKRVILYHPAYVPLTGSVVANGVKAVFAINHRSTKRRWLHYGEIPSNLLGYSILKSSILKSVTFMTRNASTGTVHIRKNNEPADIYTMDLNNENIRIETDINLFLNAGDILKVFTETGSGFDYPIAILEIYETQD